MNPTVLIFIKYYLPAYKCGGPVRTISNLVDHLGDCLDFRIVCSDRDSLEESSFPGIVVDAWNQVGRASVFYASPDFMTYRNIERLLRDTAHDVLYFNSFFHPSFTFLPLLAYRLRSKMREPIIVAPRGEFSPNALAIRKWKKRLYFGFSRLLGLYRDVTWQASSEYESADIRRALGVTDEAIVVASNLPPIVSNQKMAVEVEPEEGNGVLRVVFLSRVSLMKNLDFALEVISMVRIPIIFDVFGLINDSSYWERCRALADCLPENVSFQYRGVVEHQHVHAVLQRYDLFFLPTLGENYGHVIHEALLAGTPALISDRTPWRDLEEAGVGWVCPLDDPDAFAAVIEGMALRARKDRLAQRDRARAYAIRVASGVDAVASNLLLFEQVAQRNR